MQEFINFISDIPRLLIIFGLIFIFLGFVEKIVGVLEVSPVYKKFTVPVGIGLLAMGFWMQYDESQKSQTNQKPISPSKSTQTTTIPNPTSSTLIVKDNNFSKNGIYNENYTRAKKGTLAVNESWGQEWKRYANIYEDFIKLPANKGYKILNSPNPNDVYEIRNETDPEVSGYLKSNNGVFYFTQYSFRESKKPKFIELIQ